MINKEELCESCIDTKGKCSNVYITKDVGLILYCEHYRYKVKED